MSQRVLISIAISVFAALGLLACGGGGDDEKAVERAVVQAITTKDSAQKCGQLSTKGFVTRVYGDIAQCRTAERPSGDDKPPTGATASDVEIDGDSAKAKVRITGGDSDGATGTIDLRKENDDWRVDDLGVDFLRSQVTAGLANDSDPSSPLSEPEVRDCARKTFLRLSDSELRRIAYMAISESDEGKAEVGKLLVDCLTSASSGSGGVSFLRQRFESGISSSARKNGMPQSAIDCVNKQLRSSISDEEISKLAFNDGELTPAMKRDSAEAFGRCQGRAGSQGTTVLRQLFERGVRAGAAKRDIPKKAVDCVIRRLRRSISDDEIVAAMTSARKKARLARRTAAELVSCGAVRG